MRVNRIVLMPVFLIPMSFVFILCQAGTMDSGKAKGANSVQAPAADTDADAQSASAVAEKKLPPQTTCPVMGGEINKKLYVDYKGKRIYVCCEGCLAELKKDPKKYLAKLEQSGESAETIKPLLQEKQLAPQTTCPVMMAPIDKKLYVTYKGQRIYVCCTTCKAQVKKDPEKWIRKLKEMGQMPEAIDK